MFKQREIISEEEAKKFQDENGDICDVCELHARTRKKAIDILGDCPETEDICPICHSILSQHGCLYNGHVVVGGHNSYTPHEKIGYYELRWCEKCNKHFALIPEEIMYNGNHDIFYTGGHYFLSKTDEEEIMSKIKTEFLKSTKSFVERVKAGETSLDESNLSYWNLNKIEQVISDYLYNKGLKK